MSRQSVRATRRFDVVAYTDGACEGNPGPGGFGAVYTTSDGERVELYGAHAQTTNNQMELMAAIALLESLPDNMSVELHTDSRYVQDGITQWLPNWKARNWRLKSGGAVKNVGLWRRLDRAAARHRVNWLWVRGHAGNDGNEVADELARLAIRHWREGRLPEAELDEHSEAPAGVRRAAAGPGGTGRSKRAGSDASAPGPVGEPSPPRTSPRRSDLFADTTPLAATKAADASRSAARRLVLASTSPYRRDQLAQLGVPFDVRDPKVDEHLAKSAGLGPMETARRLASEKAQALASNEPDALLIGADQVLMFAGDRLDKPGSRDRAIEQLLTLAGRTHHLLTAAAVHDATTGETFETLDVHEMTMRPLSREQARAYVEADATEGCVGGYRYESRGVALFRRVHGEDATAIVGLPMIWLCTTLAELGFDPLAVRRPRSAGA